jgi:hypothetical protein
MHLRKINAISGADVEEMHSLFRIPTSSPFFFDKAFSIFRYFYDPAFPLFVAPEDMGAIMRIVPEVPPPEPEEAEPDPKALASRPGAATVGTGPIMIVSPALPQGMRSRFVEDSDSGYEDHTPDQLIDSGGDDIPPAFEERRPDKAASVMVRTPKAANTPVSQTAQSQRVHVPVSPGPVMDWTFPVHLEFQFEDERTRAIVGKYSTDDLSVSASESAPRPPPKRKPGP